MAGLLQGLVTQLTSDRVKDDRPFSRRQRVGEVGTSRGNQAAAGDGVGSSARGERRAKARRVAAAAIVAAVRNIEP